MVKTWTKTIRKQNNTERTFDLKFQNIQNVRLKKVHKNNIPLRPIIQHSVIHLQLSKSSTIALTNTHIYQRLVSIKKCIDQIKIQINIQYYYLM